MNKKHIPTVTIGIPAFNERNTIQNLLKAILKQSQKTCIIQKIIVTCDGSEDSTPKIVKKLQENFPIISLKNNKTRRGKLFRLKQLYRYCKSDYILTLDADIMLGNENVIENMISCFTSKRVVAVSGNNIPFKAGTFVERLINRWSMVWYEVRKDINGGTHIQNARGSILMMKKDFAKLITFPPGIISDAKIIFFTAKKMKKSFVFARNAIAYYHSSDNVYDYLLQTKRVADERDKIAAYFGNWTYNEYYIPRKYKIKGILKSILTHPIMTTLAGIFMLSIEKRKNTPVPSQRNEIWRISKSSKKSIQLLF